MTSLSPQRWMRGELFLVSQEDSAVVPETGAAANLACFSWRARNKRILNDAGF